MPALQPVPDFLKSLFNGDNPNSESFLKYIRAYNSALWFASLGNTLNDRAANPLYYRVHGQMYHNISRNVQHTNNNHRYAQLYFLDSDQGLTTRQDLKTTNFQSFVLEGLDKLIREINPFARSYQLMRETIAAAEQKNPNNVRNIRMYFRRQIQTAPPAPGGIHAGRLNEPVSNEIAAIYTSADGEAPLDRDICARNKADNGWISIPVLSAVIP